MRRAPILAVLLLAPVLRAADFNIETTSSFGLQDTQAGEVRNTFSALMDDSLNDHWHFVWGAEYERHDFNNNPVLPSSSLQALGGHLGLEYREKGSEDPLFVFELQPGWHGGQDFGSGAFDIPITLASGCKLTAQLDAAFGVYYAHLARYEVLPVGGLIWKPSKKVELDLVFPMTTLTWTVTEKNSLALFANELGTGFQVKDSTNASVRFEYYQTKTGLQWEHDFAPGWSTTLQGGWSFDRTIDYYEQKRTTSLPVVPFVALGLKARF